MKPKLKNIIKNIFALTLFSLVGLFSLTVSASEIDLSQEQKEKYYQQYQNDLKQLQQQYEGQETLNVSVATFEYFEKNGWIEPSKYKETLIEVMTSQIVESETELPKTRNITTSITKSFNVTNTTGSVIGKINATVTPNSAYHSGHGGMVFTSPGTITTAKGSGSGTWSKTHAGVAGWPQAQPYTYFPYSFTGSYVYQGVSFPVSANFTVSISKNGELS